MYIFRENYEIFVIQYVTAKQYVYLFEKTMESDLEPSCLDIY